MSTRSFTRRQVVKTLVALGLGGIAAPLVRAGAQAAEKPAFRWNFDSHEPTPENFADLCAFITLTDDLDPGMMKEIYRLMMDEPWGPSHITRLHTKISAELKKDPAGKKRPAADKQAFGFDEGETWFAGHLLMAWYTGMYFNASRPRVRVAYEKALMYRAVEGRMPVPMLEPAGFGGWTKLPEEKE